MHHDSNNYVTETSTRPIVRNLFFCISLSRGSHFVHFFDVVVNLHLHDEGLRKPAIRQTLVRSNRIISLDTLRIQVCPKKGLPLHSYSGMGLEPSILFDREGFGSLGTPKVKSHQFQPFMDRLKYTISYLAKLRENPAKSETFSGLYMLYVKSHDQLKGAVRE